VIRYLIRQERTGGHFFIRRDGRAVELDDAGYQFLARLHETQNRPDPLWDLHGGDSPGARGGLTELLRSRGLDRPEAWSSVRHVPSDVPCTELPADASAAPKRIYFEITRGCNLACQSCFNNSHHRLPDELTVDEILDVNRQAYELGVFEIRYTGGECTTVPGFAGVIADARKRGFYISVGTNGVYSDEQLSWLPYCGIDWFIISLDGDRETHNRVRGANTFDRVLRTLAVLVELPSVRVRVNMTVARHNVAEIEAVARVADSFRAGSVNLIPLRPYGRAAKTMAPLMFDGAGYYEYIREVRRLRELYPDVEFITAMDLEDPRATTSRDRIVQKKQTCAAGVEACVVGPQGHVFGCSYSPASFPNEASDEERELFIAGSLRTETLREIWRDSRRWQVFRDLEKSKNEKCHSCDRYKVRCTGSCQIMSYYEKKHRLEVAEGRAGLKDFHDPYCPKDAFELRRPEPLDSPCGGRGMDG
jgi:radical SAM protein with 4Fe4S-binding SPASM domain